MKPSSPSEIEDLFSSKKRIDHPLFLDSKPYTPFKWPVFIFFLAIIGSSSWLLFKNFFVGDIPPDGVLNFFLVTAFVGILLVPPIAIYYLLNLLFPTKLLIDEVGVTMWGCGLEKGLKWTDMESITIEEQVIKQKTIFRIKIKSNHGTLNWGYYLGVDPTALENFLVLQRSLFAPGQNV